MLFEKMYPVILREFIKRDFQMILIYGYEFIPLLGAATEKACLPRFRALSSGNRKRGAR